MYFKQIDEIIAGTKTQTRRIVKPGEDERIKPVDGDILVKDSNGDLWVKGYIWKHRDITEVRTAAGRLKWRVGSDYAVSSGRGKPGVWLDAGGKLLRDPQMVYKRRYGGFHADGGRLDGNTIDPVWMLDRGWQPLRIVITAIRREPLQAISEEDAIAEGIKSIAPTYEGFLEGKHLYPWADSNPAYYDYLSGNWRKLKDDFCCCYEGKASLRGPAVCSYKSLWESINGRGSWDRNPEVWVISFHVKGVGEAQSGAHTQTEQD